MVNIIKRELFNTFENSRFILLFLFSVFLFTLNGVILPNQYHEAVNYYNVRAPYKWKYYVTRAAVYTKPNPLVFVAEGGYKYLPKEYLIKPSGIIRPEIESHRDSKLPDIPELDWAFIIKIIFSLYVVLIAYNSISGEKEEGTLRLTLSNSLSRAKLLIAKYCALMITIMVPLITGMLISLLPIVNFMPEVLDGTLIIRLLMIFIITLIYLSVFVFLSLMISSLIHQSSLVLLVLMIIWILFTITGDIAGILSDEITKVPSEMDIANRYNNLDFTNYYDEFRNRVNRGEFESEEEVKKEGELMFVDIQKNLNIHIANYYNALMQRTKLAHNLSRFSPIELYQYASERIAGTGIKYEENFLEDLKGFSTVFDNYLIRKTGELPLVFDFGNFKFTADFKRNTITIVSPREKRYDFDDSDFPIFQESKQSFTRTLRDAMLDLSGLLLWNIVLAMGAFLAFNRADVR